eukprot:12918437-Prorocentrum_lima.AAC.1
MREIMPTTDLSRMSMAQELERQVNRVPTTLAGLEVEPYKAMFCQEAKVEQPTKKKAVWRNCDHETTPP